jgi:hypothetical protein
MMTMTFMQSARVLALAILAVLFTTGRSPAEDKSGPYTGTPACTEKMNNCVGTCDSHNQTRSGDDYNSCIKSCVFQLRICGNATTDVKKSGTGTKAIPSVK